MGFNGNRQHSSFPPHYSHLYFCDARQNVHQLRPNRRGVSMQPANNYTSFTRRLPPLSAYEHRFPRFARSSTPVLTPRSRTAENNEDSDHRLILTQKHLEAEQAKRMNVEKQIAVLTESYKTRIIGLESQLKECNNNSSNIEEPKNKLTISQKEYCDNLQQNDQELDHFGKRLELFRKSRQKCSVATQKTTDVCLGQCEEKLRKYKSTVREITAENKDYKKRLREADERDKSYRHSIIYNQAGNNKSYQSQISNLENDKKKLEVENEYLKQKCQDLIAGIDFCRVKPESVSSRSEQKEAELQKLRMQIDGLQKCNDTFSSHIDKLEAEKNGHKWQKEKENEYIKTELERYKIELESAKSQNEQLKAVNDGLQESNQKLMEIKKENSQLNDDLNRLRADLDANADALEMKNKEIERLMNSIAQNSEQSCPRVELEACQTELEKCKADLEKAQDDRDRFKEQHKISNENLEITEQKLLKAGTRMQAQECEQHDDQIKELMRKLNNCQEEQENGKVELQNCRDDIREITAERDRVKEELEVSTQRFTKFNLKMEKELTQQQKAGKERLRQELANSRQVKAELVKAKESIKELSTKNETLLTEWQRTSKLYMQSLTSQPNNDFKNFVDDQGPCPSMPNVADEVIDISDDDEMKPSKSKKNKQS